MFFMRAVAATTAAIVIRLFLATAAEAGPIICSAASVTGQSGSSTVHQAVGCTGTGIFGEAGRGSDGLHALNALGTFGTGWELLSHAGLPEANVSYGGGFLLDPAAPWFRCENGACTEFIVAVKWEGMFAFFSLGALTASEIVQWELSNFALAHINVYGRSLQGPAPAVTTPEPGTLALLGIGLAAVARAFRRRRVKTGQA